MIKGIGTDIIEVERIKLAIERHGERFIQKIFTTDEIVYCQKHKEYYRHYAARFAAKEAVSKAFGVGIGKEFDWLDIEVIHDSRGKPQVRFSPLKAKDFAHLNIQLSISHCKAYATATALLEDPAS